MILDVTDKIGLGQLILEAAGNKDTRQMLLDNPNEMLRNYVSIPAGHRIKVVPAEDHVTLMMLPSASDLEAGRSAFSYPSEYDPDSPDHIDPQADPQRAFAFLLGDYILKSCK